MKINNDSVGWLSSIEGCILSELACRARSDHAIVTIGCYKGRSISYMLDGVPDATMYGIDIQKQPEMEQYVDCINYIIADSGRMNTSVVKEPIDLLFIDGDHTAEGLKRDIENWFPRVAPKGVIVVHDFNKICGYHHQHEVQESTTLNLFCPDPFKFVPDKFLLGSFIHTVDTMCIVQLKY